MSTWLIYLVMIADNINSALGVSLWLIIGFGIFALFPLCIHMDTMSDIPEKEKLSETSYKYYKCLLILIVFLVVFKTIIPNTKQALIIIGISSISSIEGIEKLPPKTIESLNKMLDEYLEDRTGDDL